VFRAHRGRSTRAFRAHKGRHAVAIRIHARRGLRIRRKLTRPARARTRTVAYKSALPRVPAAYKARAKAQPYKSAIRGVPAGWNPRRGKAASYRSASPPASVLAAAAAQAQVDRRRGM